MQKYGSSQYLQFQHSTIGFFLLLYVVFSSKIRKLSFNTLNWSVKICLSVPGSHS